MFLCLGVRELCSMKITWGLCPYCVYFVVLWARVKKVIYHPNPLDVVWHSAPMNKGVFGFMSGDKHMLFKLAVSGNFQHTQINKSFFIMLVLRNVF